MQSTRKQHPTDAPGRPGRLGPMRTRRQFVREAALALAAAALAPASAGSRLELPFAAASPPLRLDYATFSELVFTPFRAFVPGAPAANWVLIKTGPAPPERRRVLFFNVPHLRGKQPSGREHTASSTPNWEHFSCLLFPSRRMVTDAAWKRCSTNWRSQQSAHCVSPPPPRNEDSPGSVRRCILQGLGGAMLFWERLEDVLESPAQG